MEGRKGEVGQWGEGKGDASLRPLTRHPARPCCHSWRGYFRYYFEMLEELVHAGALCCQQCLQDIVQHPHEYDNLKMTISEFGRKHNRIKCVA